MERKTVAVDFDGVLHQYEGWKGERHYDLPYSWARDFLERLMGRGYEVVIFTTRARAGVRDWLEQHGMADLELRIENEKPPAVAYVDDRGVRFDPRDMDKVFDQIEKVPWWKSSELK